MNRRQFITVALFTAVETYFFNECLFEGDYLFAFFWGILLFRDLQRTYKVDKIIHTLSSTTKKKD